MIVLQGIMAFFACLFFAVIYNTPRKQLFACGITGGLGFASCYLFTVNLQQPLFGTFIGASVVAICARVYSVNRNIPVMLYVLPAVFPLVPGAGMYNTMYGFLINDLKYAMENGIQFLKVTGLVVIALLIVLSLPQKFFRISLHRIMKFIQFVRDTGEEDV